MNRMPLLFLACCCLNSSGQTNSSPARTNLFTLYHLEPLTLNPGPATAEIPLSPRDYEKPRDDALLSANEDFTLELPAPKTNLSAETMTAEARERALMMKYYERLERGGYLTRPPPPSDNLLVRFADSTLRPEVFKIGNVSVTCSIVTAIKRKNPLCLLSPMILGISW